MSDSHETYFKTSRSFYTTESPKESLYSDSSWKSDINVVAPNELTKFVNVYRNVKKGATRNGSGEYYKRYEHDEIPVKDYSSTNDNSTVNETCLDDKGSLTNSDLRKLEKKIYSNISQELQTDESSMSSLDSNIKFFRTTVQQIFDNFYTSMRDYELYKKKFHEILAKNKEESIADMEEFIKDMIQHIMSSDSSVCNDNTATPNDSNAEVGDKEANVDIQESNTKTATSENYKIIEKVHSIVQAYKNENYLTDSTVDEKSSKRKLTKDKDEILNIYLLSDLPYVQIKMNNRNLLSEINIKNPNSYEKPRSSVASADNLKKLTAKKIELENYIMQQQDVPDRDIPVKISYAKKNIHLNEDFVQEHSKMENNKSFMSKICNYLCKKFRKT